MRGTPAECEFRRLRPGANASPTFCALAARWTGGLQAARVDDAICETCCRHPLPPLPYLNPVIASLVYAANGKDSRTVADALSRHQNRQFALCSLAVDHSGQFAGTNKEPTGAPAVPHTSRHNVPHRKSYRGTALGGLQIGLVGEHAPTGLGHMHLDLARHLGLARWLVPHRTHQMPIPAGLSCRVDILSRIDTYSIERSLKGLDVVLFVEQPMIPGLTRLARTLGVRVACVPMWEYLHPGQDWLSDVDLMLCPTRSTYGLLVQWQTVFGFRWQVREIPWPIDVARFPFQPRTHCRRFVFVAGSGGSQGVRLHGPTEPLRRKGLDVLLSAARLAPELSFIVYSLVPLRDVPANVELRPSPVDNTFLYVDGDVCVQPSHWEGLGLPLLECQAAGMPLVTTDFPPMNEHQPFRVISAREEIVSLTRDLWVRAAHLEPQDLVTVLRSVHGRRIAAASRSARRYILRHHNWARAKPAICEALRSVCQTEPSTFTKPSPLGLSHFAADHGP